MRRPRFSPGMFRRIGGRNHVTKPWLEALEPRWLLSGDAALAQAFGQLPLSFELNQGQTDPQVDFLSRGSGYGLFLTPTEAVLSLQAAPAPGAEASQAAPASVLSMNLVGASATPQVVGQDQLPGASNYLIGNDPSQWHTNIPNYAQVAERSVYPGVDLVYYGNQQQLEYNFTVSPGADPGVIRLAFTGAQPATLDAQGNLVLQTAGGAVVEEAPVLYQESGGVRQAVSGQYVLEEDGEVGFAVGSYDPSQPLVIDPVLSYSSYLGGSGDDGGQSIAVDSAGNAYVMGSTSSTNFPTANPLQATYGGNTDVFVAKLNAAGSALVYSTYLGGSGFDLANGIAVDSAGNAYVTGSTSSTNFPTANPLQATNGSGGIQSAFVAKLNPAGSALVYSTYLDGSGSAEATGIAVDSAGDAYVTGVTDSTNFPTANALQPAFGGGIANAFVAKLNPAGSALVYSTYLGGSGFDAGTGIAVDSAGNAYVAGATDSTNFPTKNPLQGANAGGSDTFVAKLNPAGSALVYSTYLGGSGDDLANGIAVDSAGNAYVTGSTNSTNFPTANPLQATNGGGGNDAFVAKLNPAGSALAYSTYLGGSGNDLANGIAVDSAGNAYVTGSTNSTNFPTANPLQATNGGGDNDAFVAKLNAAGSALAYSTYLGGSGDDYTQGIAVDGSGNAYVTGSTASSNFPTKNPLQATFQGGTYDGFVLKLAPMANTTTIVTSAPVNPSVYGQSVTFTATVAANPPGGGIPTGTVQFQIDGTNFGSAVTLVNGSATSGATSSLSVAAHTIRALYSGDTSFMASSGMLTQTVNPAALTITSNSTSKTYGQTVTFAGMAFTSTGLVNGDMVSSVTETSAGAAATATVASSPYSIVPSAAVGTGLGNYTIGYINGALTVNPAALSITANSTSKTYGQTASFAGTAFTTSGLVNGDTVTSVTETSAGAVATAPVSGSPYPITPSAAVGTGLGNYTITDVNGALTVNPAPLTITANSTSKTYGQTVTFAGTAFTSSGLVNGDTVNGVTETSAGAATAALVSGSPYSITPSTAVGTGLGNYTIGYINGALTVNPAALSITANSTSKTYGQTVTFAGTAFTTSALVNGDTVTSVTETSAGAAATATVAGSPYSILPSAAVGTGLGNYTIGYINGALTVNPAALSITANYASMTYGQTATFADTAFTTSGLVNGDTVSGVTETSAGAAATATVASSPYSIAPSAAVGTGLGNYTIGYINGALTVNPAALSITANSTSKTYGQTASFAGTAFTTSGLVNGDTVSGVTETSAGAAATATVAGSPYSILPSAAVGTGLGNYTIGYINGALTVNPAALSITANSTSKTYGQTASFAGTAFTTSGLVNGDTVSGVTETSAGAAATATVASSPYSIVPSAAVGTGLGNYTIGYINGALTVNPAALSITANSTSKTYGQTASFAGTAFTTSALVNGDTVTSVTETSAGAAATATVAGSPYSILPSAAVGTGLGNYTIGYINGALTVNPAALSITANYASMTYGQTASFAGTAFTTSGLVNGDTVSGVTETSAGAAATATVAGSPYSILPSAAVGTGLGNYTIGYINGALTVNPAALSITANSTSKTYGQTASFAGTAFTTSGLVNGDTVSGVTETSAGAAATATVAGSPYSILPSAAVGTGLGNYTIGYINGALTVNPAALSITANSTSKTYGQTASFAGTAFTTSGLVNGDTVSGVTETSAGAAATATVASSPYSIVPSAAVGTGLGNYTIGYINGALTVNPAALSITANSTSKTYGQTASFAGTAFTTSALVNGDTVSGVTETSAGAAATATVAGSPYSILPSAAVGTGLGNYTIGYINGALTVNPAALSITANSTSKTYGQTASFAGTAFTTSGLVNGDTVSGVTETSTGSAASAAVGTYPIVPSAATFSAGLGINYAITYGDGTLTVNAAPLMITANNTSKTYGQAASFPSTAFTTIGLVNGDTVGGVTETSTGPRATAAVGTDPIVPGAAVFSAGLSSNYTITYASGTLTVNPAPLTITANDSSKTYGQTATFAASAFTTIGLVNGDTISGVTETSTGSGSTAAVGTDPIVPSAATFSAGLSSNYTISYANGTLTVNPAALSITANNASKTYGQTATLGASAFTTSGLVNGDTVASVTESSTGSGPTTAVGTYPTVPSAATFSAGLGSNYAITFANGTLVVNPAMLTIAWPNPADITTGTALGPAQLDASVSVPGTFTYAPAAGTVLASGQGQVLSLSFTPTDADYSTATGSTTINVLSPTPMPPHATGIFAVGHSKKGLTSITVAFNEALDPGSASTAGLYSVLGAVKKRGKTVYSKGLGVKGIAFDGNTHVTINLAKPYKGVVQVTVQSGLVAANGASNRGSVSMIAK